MYTFGVNSRDRLLRGANMGFCTVAAVALPQVCHWLGTLLGIGAGIGELLLPMHLPVLLCGFYCGPLYGLMAGALSPLVSFLLTGMPTPLMLPVLVAELAVYGLSAGLVRQQRLSPLCKTMVALLAGRIARALLVLTVVGLSLSALPLTAAYMNVLKGLPGVAIQLVVLPYMLKRWMPH